VADTKFKIEPQRLLYSSQWLHTGTPPDFHLQLVRDPALWFDAGCGILKPLGDAPSWI
jgi:hypothetical protein